MARGGLDTVFASAFGRSDPLPERALVLGVAGGLVAVTALGAGDWTVVQYVVALVVAVDLGGRVVVAALGQDRSATPAVDEPSAGRRLAFAAGHVHPFALSVVFQPLDPLYGGAVYAVVAGGVVATAVAPRTLRAGFALAAVVAAVAFDSLVVAAPAGLAWFVPVYALAVLAPQLVRPPALPEAQA